MCSYYSDADAADALSRELKEGEHLMIKADVGYPLSSSITPCRMASDFSSGYQTCKGYASFAQAERTVVFRFFYEGIGGTMSKIGVRRGIIT